MYKQITPEDLKKSKVLSDVWSLVCQAHQGQHRKGLNKKGENPLYVTHPLRAMEITANALGEPGKVLMDKKYIPVLAAALAHDAIEDTPLDSQEKLEAAFVPLRGEKHARETAALVQELSNPPGGFPGATKPERDAAKKVWQSEHAKTMSLSAKIVKMADQIANTIDCVDVFMLKPNEKGVYEPVWTQEKKVSYVEKAAAVCAACLVGTDEAAAEEKTAFDRLKQFEKQAYDYAYLKIENPMLCSREFFNELDGSRKVPVLNFMLRQSRGR